MADEKAAWTVLVYMAGDNNLTEEMVWGLQELKKASARLGARKNLKPKDRVNVSAHFDPRGSRSRRYDFLPSGNVQEAGQVTKPGAESVEDGNLSTNESAIYTRRPAPPKREVQADTPNVESSHPQALTDPLVDFVKEQLHRLPPAKNYFLVLSGHGSGAVGDFLNDSDPTTSLSIPKLALLLGEARRQGPRLSILGMDSCLMSNAEVCCEVSSHADYLVASEGWVANAGWPYHRVLEACVDGQGSAISSARVVAARVAKNYSTFYRDYEISEVSTDIAVCNLGKFRSDVEGSLFLESLAALSKVLANAFDTVYIRNVITRTTEGLAAARRLRNGLSQEIAGLLGPAKGLQASLLSGSARAQTVLSEGLKAGKLTSPQWKALRELLRSSGRLPVLDNTGLEEYSVEHPDEILDLFNKPGSPSAAVACVRLGRELDPGVDEVLRLIEQPGQYDRATAKQVRICLQKFHQLQSVLELHGLVKRFKTFNVSGAKDLLDSVVLARWQAQSFKGGVYVDVYDLCHCLELCLAKGNRVTKLCQNVRKAVAGCISAPYVTGPDNQHAHGLSVYFPYQSADYTIEYDNLEFAKHTGWGRVIRSYLRATRRERRDESQHWKKNYLFRFGRNEVDPLEPDGIEARIVGVVTLPALGEDPRRAPGKEGSEAKVRNRAGSEAKIRAGSEAKIRAGTEAKIRGEGVQFVWGNPPDGFFRQKAGN